jgi:DNA-binding MarR family transcriptional regulator
MSRRASGPVPPTPDGAAPRWLTDDEMAAWLPLVRMLTLLPGALDTQLREEAGISHVYYQVLALLSDAPDRALRMTQLARAAGTSVSRLSHAVASLEERGWVLRTPSPDDRRGQVARLTDDGQAALAAAAPGHVAAVRRLVFDRLGSEDVAALRRIAEAVLRGT